VARFGGVFGGVGKIVLVFLGVGREGIRSFFQLLVQRMDIGEWALLEFVNSFEVRRSPEAIEVEINLPRCTLPTLLDLRALKALVFLIVLALWLLDSTRGRV